MGEKAKIVMIDDEIEVCNLVKTILERTGRYEVVISTHPQEGIEMVKLNKPDLILLDQIMPEMSGTQTAQVLYDDEATKDTTIVFLSALAIPMAFVASMVEHEDLKDKPGQAGGQYFIQKPISAIELVERLDRILADNK